MSQQSLWITSTVSKVMNISLPIFAGNYLEDVTQPFFSLLRKANASSCRADAHLVSDGFVIQVTVKMRINGYWLAC